MDDARRTALVTQLDELDARDRALAEMLAELASLIDDVQGLRHDAVETVGGLERLPADRAHAETERAAADAALAVAKRALTLAEAELAGLERSRKQNEDDVERARKELRQATADLDDATARADRARTRLDDLDELAVALGAAAEGLVVTARGMASRLQTAPRVTESGKGAPGPSVAGLDEWGARARAALFLAHSTLATERERVLHEANALGAGVLGPETGALSVALVRQRVLEQL